MLKLAVSATVLMTDELAFNYDIRKCCYKYHCAADSCVSKCLVLM